MDLIQIYKIVIYIETNQLQSSEHKI
jgi:hypothetical protein